MFKWHKITSLSLSLTFLRLIFCRIHWHHNIHSFGRKIKNGGMFGCHNATYSSLSLSFLRFLSFLIFLTLLILHPYPSLPPITSQYFNVDSSYSSCVQSSSFYELGWKLWCNRFSDMEEGIKMCGGGYK